MNTFVKVLANTALMSFICVVTVTNAQQRPPLPGGYPTKPIRVVVAAPAGGSVDFTTRLIMGRISEHWGYNFVMEHRDSGPGLVNTVSIVVRAPPDAYTLLVGSTGVLINASLLNKVPYDVRKDLAPISRFSSQPYVLVTTITLPVNSVKELIAYAKSKPGALNYASAGIGSSIHLSMELFKSATGTDLVHVPYRGGGPAMIALLGGQEVQLQFSGATTAMPQVKGGKLKALASSGSKRSRLIPDLPTVSESGVPGFEVSGWYGLLAPAGAPKAIIEALNQEINRIQNLPNVQEKLLADGAEIEPGSPAQFRGVIAQELDKMDKLIKKLDLKL